MWVSAPVFDPVLTAVQNVAPTVLVGLLGIVVTVGIVAFVINRTRRAIR